MWAKIDLLKEPNKISLPYIFKNKIGNNLLISFGIKKMNANVIYNNCFYNIDNSNYDNPIDIKISQNIAEYLHLNNILTYRIKLINNNICFGPVIGFLLGNLNHNYTPEHMQKYSDRLNIYNKIGGLICAFSPTSIKWQSQDVYGLYYNPITNKWHYSFFPIPNVIYRRDFHYSEKVIEQLINITGNKLFNSYRFLKDEFNSLLLANDNLKEYIPPFMNFNGYNSFVTSLKQFNNIILKPTNLSRGRGICIILSNNNKYAVYDYRTKDTLILKDLSILDLKKYILKNLYSFKNYLIQKYINFATIQDKIFDIRIVLQKNIKGVWQITGGEARVANKDYLITNISRGAFPMDYKEAIFKSFDKCTSLKILNNIQIFCYKFFQLVESLPYHIAELGIDLGVDKNAKLWFIEANVFPSFKGFKIIDNNTYLKIRYAPMLYSLFLSEFLEEGEEIDINENY